MKNMNYLIKINQRMPEFTPSDKKIADFIVDNPRLVLNSNTQQLATMIETSQSAIIRFVKKIGYKGYVDLKLEIAKSLEEDTNQIEDEVIRGGESTQTIVSKSKNNVLSAVEKTFALLEDEVIENSIKYLVGAGDIYLAGVGSSGLVCEDFLYKLQRAGQKAYYQRDAHTNLALITNIKKDDVLVCISYSGTTKEVIIAADYAKNIGAKVITITKGVSTRLSKLSDQVLLIPEIEKEMRFGAVSSRLSSQIVTEILYYGYLADNMNDVTENLKISKQLTNNLKDK